LTSNQHLVLEQSKLLFEIEALRKQVTTGSRHLAQGGNGSMVASDSNSSSSGSSGSSSSSSNSSSSTTSSTMSSSSSSSSTTTAASSSGGGIDGLASGSGIGSTDNSSSADQMDVDDDSNGNTGNTTNTFNRGRSSPPNSETGRVNFAMANSTRVDTRGQADNGKCIQMFRRLECSLSVVIIEMDRNFNICYVSPGIRYFTGETPRLLIGKFFCNTIHKEDVKRVRPKFRELLQQGLKSSKSGNPSIWPSEAGPIRYRRKRSGGGYMWVEAVGHSVGTLTGTGCSDEGVLSSAGGGSSRSAWHHTLVFSERNISRCVVFCVLRCVCVCVSLSLSFSLVLSLSLSFSFSLHDDFVY